MAPEKRSTLFSFAAGGAAGALDTCITMPLDTVKTQMQINRHASVVSCVRTILRHDGAAGLYYGFGPFLLQASGKAAVRFCMFDVLVKAVDAAGIDRTQRPAVWSGVCGLGAGLAEALLWTAPTERVKGVAGLYVGAGATAARQATSVAMRFFFLDSVKGSLCGGLGYEKRSAPSWVTFISGGVGGFLSAVLNNPIDVVKSRIQSGNGGVGMLGAMREVVAERGLSALGAGLQARAARLFMSQAIQFSVVEKLLALGRPSRAVEEKPRVRLAKVATSAVS
ncbi:hypothetical protein EMIHUDRAFT_207393 [Emiliania huxleyi CCMP1516]|uniref:Mitochondrial carrier protein n=2 Tax=Emiliania huxleyi TaxID=2903 RepID=A0A0D3IR22_EMIH1|nr:hypothetical protein EMIHUDRAFT_246674 [Emiliania huxleyi CCMP1516]XP_005774660.1 hypothetical protein EMIHUDRAFT_207393 [Emiliania huxleyi CCMP1516]EOD13707.1 hypothetical protein EMIHUDRAFT_246674 [Emiliania huxleyi CCMP1516]EOD22231.1 hypothetical protein EMIHUDRAFT_207393 [Emiliania huxleyi CCMP1516]|eukprot:XP_005766136.1 hypothetical protein EMIHUDRAFT_246674 [Emiliania huxleyi CCMP1516]